MTMAQTKKGQLCTIKQIGGDTRFISRITSVGLTLGTKLEVLQNGGRFPILLYTRDTMLAVNKKEAENIIVEVETI